MLSIRSIWAEPYSEPEDLAYPVSMPWFRYGSSFWARPLDGLYPARDRPGWGRYLDEIIECWGSGKAKGWRDDRDATPHQRLWRAVLFQAVEDAEREKLYVDSWDWLEIACEACGLDAELARDWFEVRQTIRPERKVKPARGYATRALCWVPARITHREARRRPPKPFSATFYVHFYPNRRWGSPGWIANVRGKHIAFGEVRDDTPCWDVFWTAICEAWMQRDRA